MARSSTFTGLISFVFLACGSSTSSSDGGTTASSTAATSAAATSSTGASTGTTSSSGQASTGSTTSGTSGATSGSTSGSPFDAGFVTGPLCDAGTDAQGGYNTVTGTATGYFHIEKIGNRFWNVDPLGHGFFAVKAMVVSPDVYQDNGQVLLYDAVYLETGSATSANLAPQAASWLTGDVVGASGATLQDVGDSLYVGWKRPPYVSYFWLSQLGVGGAIDWYYSSSASGGWTLINGTGKPAGVKSETVSGGEPSLYLPGVTPLTNAGVLDSSQSYALDVGGWLAVDPATGFVAPATDPKADRIFWFDAQDGGLPTDFATTALASAGSTTPLYYIKGVVTQAFTTAPILSQLYEREILEDSLNKKYGPGTGDQVTVSWLNALDARFRAWGFNAIGGYGSYNGYYSKVSNPLPYEHTEAINDDLMDLATGAVKNVMGNQSKVCPNVSTYGGTIDSFDPLLPAGIAAHVAKGQDAGNDYAGDRVDIFVPDEADSYAAFDSVKSVHVGFMALSQNPYQPSGFNSGGNAVTYADPRFWAKYALRDLLRQEYRVAGDPAPAFTINSTLPAFTYTVGAPASGSDEAKALAALNTAWGTAYTSWDTSSGSIPAGTNAYATGTGTGFMDENGSGILVTKGCTHLTYDDEANGNLFAAAAVETDLDAYLPLFVGKYASVMQAAVTSVVPNHAPIFLPIYNGPLGAYQGAAPYVDGFWATFGGDVTAAVATYDALTTKRPIVAADYLTASLDSPEVAAGTIQSATSSKPDGGAAVTQIVMPDMQYTLAAGWFASFPGLTTALPDGGTVFACAPLDANPIVKSNGWTSITVDGDYSACLLPGQQVYVAEPLGTLPNQTARVAAMVAFENAFLAATGSDDAGFVIGFEHWDLYDYDATNTNHCRNSGILTEQDNAFDGVEAVSAVSLDANGRMVGGENADYGNLLGPLTQQHTNICGLLSQ